MKQTEVARRIGTNIADLGEAGEGGGRQVAALKKRAEGFRKQIPAHKTVQLNAKTAYDTAHSKGSHERYSGARTASRAFESMRDDC